MSLIHEALEKLEQEKKSGWRRPAPVPPAEMPLGPLRGEPSHQHSGVLYAVAGLLIFFFLAGLVYFFTRPETENGEASSFFRQTMAPPPKKLSSPAMPFLRNQFSLTGITQVGSDWTAIVNNELVRVGDQVGGATVDSIQAGGVILKSGDQLVELRLYGDSPVHLSRLEPPSP